MESQEIIEAAKKRLPVVYDGVVYKEILEYILWFDSNRNKQRSVVLLDQNGYTRVRALASRITLAEKLSGTDSFSREVPMLTSFELSKKLAELNIEFCKTLNANNGTEALRWISTTMEFLEALLAESVDSGSLTQNERGVLLATKASSKNHCDNLQSLLQRRKERRTS